MAPFLVLVTNALFFLIFQPCQCREHSFANLPRKGNQSLRTKSLRYPIGGASSSSLSSSSKLDKKHQPAKPKSLLPNADILAKGLGYIVGAGSLLLYTPIAFRILRKQNADGLSIWTWWLELYAFTCSDIYYLSRGYPISTYIETLIITLESLIILLLVSHFQTNNNNIIIASLSCTIIYIIFLLTALSKHIPSHIESLGQLASSLLHSSALISQLKLNHDRRSSGDYSPLTSVLALGGCFIRVFTTMQLAGSDVLLLFGFGSGLVLNGALLGQIIWYGMREEKLGLLDVLLSDFGDGDDVGGG